MKSQAVRRSIRFFALRRWRRRGGLAYCVDAFLAGLAFALVLAQGFVLLGLAK